MRLILIYVCVRLGELGRIGTKDGDASRALRFVTAESGVPLTLI